MGKDNNPRRAADNEAMAILRMLVQLDRGELQDVRQALDFAACNLDDSVIQVEAA